MTAIHIPRRGLSVPQGRVALDWSHPIAGDLVAAENPRTESGRFVRVGSVSHAEWDGGMGYGLDGASYLRDPESVVRNFPLTFLSLFKRTAGSAGCPMSIGLGSQRHAMYFLGDGRIRVFSGSGGTGSENGSASAPLDTEEGPSWMAARVHASDSRDIWHAGRLLDSNAGTVSTTEMSTLAIGTYWNSDAPALTFSGSIYLACAWARALADEELQELYLNPWQLFRADPIRIYSLPAGGSSQSLAASGTATATGTAAAAAQVALAGVGVSLASGSASIAASRPLAASGTSTASGTAAPKIDIALSALGLTVASGAATLSSNASGSLAATGSATAGGSAAAVANVTISASGLAQAAAQAGLAASVLLAGAGAAAAAGNAALALQLKAAAAGAAQAGGTATLQGSTAGQLSASGPATAGGSAALRLDVRLQAAGGAQAGGSADLQESGTRVTLTAAGFVQAMGAGVLKIDIALAAIGAGRASGAAVLVPAGLAYSSARRLPIEAEGRRLAIAAENRTLVIA